jgi:protein-L-isoaspartate(D-aspartate) O-methyltransferase
LPQGLSSKPLTGQTGTVARHRKKSGSEVGPPSEFIADLRQRGIREPWVLEAMAAVRREHFVESDLTEVAYEDRPLPIGLGQTISQPFMVAYMAQCAEIDPTDAVLEVGTGSGYGAAILGYRARTVTSIERLDDLATSAENALSQTGVDNVHVVVGDGTLGWPAGAPYDVVVVTAAGPRVPQALLNQLAEGGRLVIPVGGRRNQRLLRVVRRGDEYEHQDLGGVRFVPLIGAEGRQR